MARLTGPLFSLTARGSFANTTTFEMVKGFPIAKVKTSPRKTDTKPQLDQRALFTFLSNLWQNDTIAWQGYWNESLSRKALPGRNNFLAKNLHSLHKKTSLQHLILSPGTGGVPPVLDLTVTPGFQSMDWTISGPVIAPGWTFFQSFINWIEDQNPLTGDLFNIQNQVGATNPASGTINGLVSGTPYVFMATVGYLNTAGNGFDSKTLNKTATPL